MLITTICLAEVGQIWLYRPKQEHSLLASHHIQKFYKGAAHVSKHVCVYAYVYACVCVKVLTLECSSGMGCTWRHQDIWDTWDDNRAASAVDEQTSPMLC